MNPFRNVGVRLSLAVAVVVAGALAVVWVALVPTLQRRLVDGRLTLLAQSARQVEEQAQGTTVDQDFIDDAAHTADATRVVYLQPIGGGNGTFLLELADSRQTSPAQGVAADPVALRAVNLLSLQRGEVTRGGEAFAEVAIPDRLGNVFLFTASLHATLENVDLVRSRLLWAGLVALGLAILVGWSGASVFARRIRRLERAADRIAAGDFSHPVADSGGDELGELATAFDRMRLQLAQLDDARRAFIANASHELRTPLFSLGGFLELLRDEELDEATRAEFLGTMSEQVQRLSKLATDLLDLSRLDAGGIRLVTETIALGELAEDLSGEFAALALRGEHRLEAATDADGAALGDRERVLQIGRALVDNALRHTPPGTAVRIVARGSTLAVEDDGPGIPAEYREQVFARFTRVEGSRAFGSGLGLAIARELAERMGGELRLTSNDGLTVFTLTLPAGVPEAESALA
ncbi:MAG: HAMP domain-containing sensor histidine kinase [Gaiellaceae bacterium]